MEKVLGILPHSIGGRLTISSVFDGFKLNGFDVEVFDELNDTDFLNFISGKTFKYIVGYDFSGLKLKVDNNLDMISINYFSDVIESNASGVQNEWQKYIPYLNGDDNYTFYWDRELSSQAEIKNLFYLPHFVNTEIYKDLALEREYDIMFAGRLDTDARLVLFTDLMQTFPNLNFAWFAIEKHYKDALSRTDRKDLIEKAYKGFIDTEEKMAVELNKAKIVFNMNSQGLTSLNYRTMQAVACKTLLISDMRAEVGLFKGNLPYYVDFEDLIAKINYFNENSNAMKCAIDNCYKIVVQNHNSKDNVKFILNCLGETSSN